MYMCCWLRYNPVNKVTIRTDYCKELSLAFERDLGLKLGFRRQHRKKMSVIDVITRSVSRIFLLF
jgi:hypothetical protein